MDSELPPIETLRHGLDLEILAQGQDGDFSTALTSEQEDFTEVFVSCNLPSASNAPQVEPPLARSVLPLADSNQNRLNIVERFCRKYAPEFRDVCLHLDTSIFRSILEIIFKHKNVDCIKPKWPTVLKLTVEEFSKNDIKFYMKNGKLKTLLKSDLDQPVTSENHELFEVVLETMITLFYREDLEPPCYQSRKKEKIANRRKWRSAVEEVYGSHEAGLRDLLK